MRLIWTCENVDLIRAFSQFLSTKSIAFSVEEQIDTNWGSDQYGTKKFLVWITDEDQVEKAIEYLTTFLASPSSPEFAVEPTLNLTAHSPATKFLQDKLHHPLQEKETKILFFSASSLTASILLLCCCIFLLEFWNIQDRNKIPSEFKTSIFTYSPVTKVLLYDYPYSYELLDKIVSSYGYEALVKPKEPSAKFLYEQYRKTPIWNGYYPYIDAWAKNHLTKQMVTTVPLNEIKTFEKIKEGQVWRLVTPAILHNDILHLFFNMIWLLVLGTQIEARIKPWKYFLLIIVLAISSNTAQYLMTGPNFIGFSGIICGMATYIRVRQKVAPWEGYQMSSATFAFICFFIGMLALFSLATLLLDVFGNITFLIGIANTAHLVGASVGYALGRMPYFSRQT